MRTANAVNIPLLLSMALAILLAASLTFAQEVRREEGVSARGAHWAVEAPANWNGTLLLYARGYSPLRPESPPETAPRGAREWLLGEGYALAASNYSVGGWALEEAPVDQIEALDAFVSRYGQPRRVIAWGNSMGGLVTLALAEHAGERIDGAISLCGSTSGSLGMLNTALDGAFAFKTLLAPHSDIRVVNVDDDRMNSARASAVLQEAMTTPQGRARVALAVTLAQIPTWTMPDSPRPNPRDMEGQLEQAAHSFVMGGFLPRVDQEQRAGGVFSWNTGIDYVRQLRASGRWDFVAAFYRRAGLDLNADLRTLNGAPRIAADAGAIAYMRTNYVPSGRLGAPTLLVHEVGDGLTIPNVARAFGDVADRRDPEMSRQTYVDGAGHCRFNLAEHVAAIRAVETRLENRRWRVSTRQMRESVREVGDQSPRFFRHRPRALLRACGAEPGSCRGEPAPQGEPPN